MNEICRKAIETYGEDLQIMVAVEEMAELTKELSKAKRKVCLYKGEISFSDAPNFSEIAEEIADVEIMLEQLKQIFAVSSIVDAKRESKLKRLSGRLKNDEGTGDKVSDESSC